MILPHDPVLSCSLSPLHMWRRATVWSATKSSWGRLAVCHCESAKWLWRGDGTETASASCLILTLQQHLWLTVRTVPHHNPLPGSHSCACTSPHASNGVSCFVKTTQRQPFSYSVSKLVQVVFRFPICMHPCLISFAHFKGTPAASSSFE